MSGVGLSEEGRRQAEWLAERLAREPIGAVFASPRERAVETASPIAERLGLPLQISDCLDEIDFGEWTGRSFDELAADPGWRAWNVERAAARPPGGEPFAAVQERVTRFVEGACRAYRDKGIVAVSHGDVIRAALCRYLNCCSLDDYRLFEVGPGSISTVVFWPGGWRVLTLNEAVAA